MSKLVWLRVAPIQGGVEIDSGDDSQTRYRLTGGKFEVIESGSETLFFRTPSCLPMVQPAEVGNIKLLKQYVNLDHVAFKLFVAWLSYTLALPKQASSKYVFLTPRGGEGSGKSELSRAAKRIIDPRVMALQILPNNAKDLAIATQNAHLLCFDNVRFIAPAMADVLCVAATGGALASRQLYSDDEQHVVFVHGAMLLNGIHAFASEPDFAQRCLPLYLEPIKKDQRKTEAEMKLGLEVDLPAIQRGLFDLIAQVFLHLPNAKVTSPERMLDFSKWLAAMEMADGAHPGVYQDAYSAALQEGQRDTLQSCVLAAAVLDYAETHVDGQWRGTPTELLNALNSHATQGTQRSRDWPMNPIALSKRLLPLQASLLTQGVSLELSRGKHRMVVIKKTARPANA